MFKYIKGAVALNDFLKSVFGRLSDDEEYILGQFQDNNLKGVEAKLYLNKNGLEVRTALSRWAKDNNNFYDTLKNQHQEKLTIATKKPTLLKCYEMAKTYNISPDVINAIPR